jgi:hypothetical protein
MDPSFLRAQSVDCYRESALRQPMARREYAIFGEWVSKISIAAL